VRELSAATCRFLDTAVAAAGTPVCWQVSLLIGGAACRNTYIT